jgi:hypothetical protein
LRIGGRGAVLSGGLGLKDGTAFRCVVIETGGFEDVFAPIMLILLMPTSCSCPSIWDEIWPGSWNLLRGGGVELAARGGGVDRRVGELANLACAGGGLSRDFRRSLITSSTVPAP